MSSIKTGKWSYSEQIAKDAVLQNAVYTTTSKIESQRVLQVIGMSKRVMKKASGLEDTPMNAEIF